MEDTLNKKRFLWGLLLAWAPWVPTVIGIGYLFVGLSDSKATGLAVVVGGMVELLVWWGIANHDHLPGRGDQGCSDRSLVPTFRAA